MGTTPITSEHLFFIDIETTGLKSYNNIWEIACIAPDGEIFREAWVTDLQYAHPRALIINRYLDRYAAGDLYEGGGDWFDRQIDVLEAFVDFLEKYESPRIMAGSGVHFDKRFLVDSEERIDKLFSHRILDVPTFVAAITDGYASGGLDGACKAVGVNKDKDVDHDALYDAWITRVVYEKAVALRGTTTLSDNWRFYNTYEEALEQNKRLFTND